MISAGGFGASLLLDCTASLDEDAFCFSLEEFPCLSLELDRFPSLRSEDDSADEESGSSTGLEDVSSPHAARNAVKARAQNPKCFIHYSFTHPRGNI